MASRVCRLLALVGTDISDSSSYDYVNAFVKASKCDPHLTNLLGKNECEGHSDGWGYAAVGIQHGRKTLSIHYRSTLPIYDDLEGVRGLSRTIQGLVAGAVIVHSRRLAEGSARVWNTHPIYYNWKGFEMWIAHNGVMDSDTISKDLDLVKLPDTTDTYYLGEYIYRQVKEVSGGELVKALRSAAKYTKSAMNTLIILYDNRSLITSVTFYLTKDMLDSPRALRYYKLFRIGSGNSFVFISSSLVTYLERTEKIEELPPQTAVIIEIELEKSRIASNAYSLV